MSCKNCKRDMSIKLVKYVEILVNNDKVEQDFATFECRNVELLNFYPQNQLSAKARESNAVFDEIDVSDLWVEYDELTQLTLEVQKFKIMCK